MSDRPCLQITAVVMIAALPSCGLVKAPFKVAGAVVEGTAKVGKKAYDKSAGAFKKSDEEKAAEAKEKEEKKAKEKAEQQKKDAANAPANPVAPAGPEGTMPSDDYLPPLPGTGQPLPDDAPVPYQGQ
jgi:hypothetical protein